MLKIQHRSVMPREVLEHLAPRKRGGLYIDCNLGEGGHSELLLKTFPDIHVVGVDADERIMEKAKRRLKVFGDRIRFFHEFNDDFFASCPFQEAVHRILFDLGISSFHFSESGRGFSFQYDEELDMRINPQQGRPLSAILSAISEPDLARVLFDFGEERYARSIAAAIVLAREFGPIDTTFRLVAIVESAVPAAYRRGRIHAATRTFQALRILVNRELDRIRPALTAAFGVLEIGGRIGVISFHSLEDRIVKHLFKELSKAYICPPKLPMCECGGKPFASLPVRKPLVPGEDEVSNNPPSRSAKFRVVEKLRENRHDA